MKPRPRKDGWSLDKLRIAKELLLPLDVVTQKAAFLGRTGSGKSYAAQKLAELMLDEDAQIVILDPVGNWYGLRVPGTGRGFDIKVFGGLHADIPLEPTGGALMADVIVDRRISAILDVSQMIPAELTRFALGFATRFFQRKKAAPSAVHVFLEECQEMVPQNPQRGGDEPKMLSAFERLVKLGRNFGIGVSLISQRPQEVNKKALNQTELLFAFQTNGPQERKAIAGWVDAKGLEVDLDHLLPRLEVGEPHVWSPQWLKVSQTVRIAAKRTFDTGSTPKVGGRGRKAPKTKPLVAVDLEQLRADMAATVERAKLEDPKALRARIAELEKAANAKAPTVAPLKAPVVQCVVVPMLTEKQRKTLERVAVIAERLGPALTHAADLTRTVFAKLADAEMARRAVPVVPVVRSPVVRTSPSVSMRDKRKVNGAGKAQHGSESPGGGLRRMMVALAQRPQGLTNRQIGVRSGLSSRSGTFATYISRARQRGWIEGSGTLRITDAGISALGHYDPLPTGAELGDYWLGELGGGASRILKVLIEAYPETVPPEDIGERAEISSRSGTYATYVSRLRSLELVEGRGALRASEELFS